MSVSERLIAEHLALWPTMPTRWRDLWHERMRHLRQTVPIDGAANLHVNDTMRTVISAHLSVAALGLGNDAFADLRGITLYPEEFYFDAVEEDELTGVVSESRSVLAGQAIGHERIVLSWQDVLHSSAHADAEYLGYNVVIHEFTHHLQASRPNGDPQALARLRIEHNTLQVAVANGHNTGILDPYGAESPEEFLAVAAETFFQTPAELQQCHPSVFELMVRSFRFDPLTWTHPTDQRPQAHTAAPSRQAQTIKPAN